MRAQLRTYHAIPSLQAHQDPHAYKQLQDAPRLKSILKGGAEDREEPNSLDKIKQVDEAPRTNPVNLIFVMCAGAQKVAELHFPEEHEFHDLIMKTKYSSVSRARAFIASMLSNLPIAPSSDAASSLLTKPWYNSAKGDDFQRLCRQRSPRVINITVARNTNVIKTSATGNASHNQRIVMQAFSVDVMPCAL